MKALEKHLAIAALLVFLSGGLFAFLVQPAPAQEGAAPWQNGRAATAMAGAGVPWHLILVNRQNPLPSTFTPETRPVANYPERLFDARAADALEALLSAAETAGQPLYLVSSYRSVSYQANLFKRKVSYYKNLGYSAATAEEMAAQWVARPGESEHNLGLAADLVSSTWYTSHTDLTEDFEDTTQFAWLQENAATYGFILRYPRGKETVTGIAYEPWHYRYVGPEAAMEIANTGLCLEEYLQKQNETQEEADKEKVYEPPFN